MSTDADGVVKVWDIRMVSERCEVDTGILSANKATFDNSGAYMVVPTDEGLIRM